MKRCWPIGAALIGFLGLQGCGGSSGFSDQAARQPAVPASKSSPTFKDVAAGAGLNFRWTIAGKHPYNILQLIGNGCAFLDYNNDGNLDILLVGPELALFRGDGHGHFMDVTHQMGLDAISGNFLGCAVGDYDNDGYDDIYISAYRGGVLLHNEKGERFTNVTRQSGIAAQPWGTSCAFGDVDNDNKLDLYIDNYVQFGPAQPQLCKFGAHMGACPPHFYLAERGSLYHNEGRGHFRDITRSWGAQNATGKALGSAFADYDGSGRQSLYVANDGVPGDLLHNLGSRFENVGEVSGTARDANGTTHAGMGMDWGDYDNDGKLDLAVAAFQHEPNCIYHNDTGNLFTERSAALGVARSSMTYLSFGCKWFDYDNDGWLDLVFSNGHVQDNTADIEPGTSYRQPSLLFHNEHGQSFTDVSASAGEGIGRKIVGRGLAVGDFDNDGREDLLIVDSEGAPLLLHNETAHVGHWLGIRLIGTTSNRDGIGAMITVEAGSCKLLRRCGTDGSYLSASDRRVHFGLGAADMASTITIRWPSGLTTRLHNVRADQYFTVKESG